MAASVVGITLIMLLWCNGMVGLQALARTKFEDLSSYSRAPSMFIYYSVGVFL